MKKLSKAETETLLKVLQQRFEKHSRRHKHIKWADVQKRLDAKPEKLRSLHDMEDTGGEPDVVAREKDGTIVFYDCAPESPKGRRSLCYDPDALESRKQHKPKHSAVGMAEEMGIELMTEDEYRQLQDLGPVDTKTSSWLKTPENIRELGGALFGDYRFGTVFIYHNGAESYYAARGFRGVLKV